MPKSNLSTEEMRTLRQQGLSYQEIALRAGVSRQNVHLRLNYVGNEEFNARRRAKRQQKRNSR